MQIIRGNQWNSLMDVDMLNKFLPYSFGFSEPPRLLKWSLGSTQKSTEFSLSYTPIKNDSLTLIGIFLLKL
jgi:hypothetical protein